MPHLELRNITRTYPGESTPAIGGVDLTLDEGEILVLVGPSGCGKSTILRLVAGLDSPDSGSITLAGKGLAGVSPQDRDVAMVFQGYALYPHMTVAENIGFPLRMRGISKAARSEKVREVSEVLGLSKLLARQPGELSGGERQRVAMGRALVRKPKLFLFDEPLSNLDAALRTSLRVELAQTLRTLGASAIYVTHDQVEAMTVGHRLAVMSRGQVMQSGSAREVYQRPGSAFVAGFLGSPAINRFDAEIEGGLARIAPELEVEIPAGVSVKGAATLAVRPEHVQVRTTDEPAGKNMLCFVAKITAAEPLGSETVIHTCHPAAPEMVIRARVPGFFDPALCGEVRLVISHEHLLWFDQKTGSRLLAEEP